MPDSIAGALSINQSVDQNGSFTLDIPLRIPQAKVKPELSLSYHSASNSPSALGLGWVLKGASLIERVPATIAQDGFRGVVNYDKDDRFALDGQRLIKLDPAGNEYRFEIERWSKVIALGDDPTNPNSWVEHLPDGTTRTFGASTDSNIKAQGGSKTRVWAISEHVDTFTNHISFAYNNDTANGSFYLTNVTYGGNRDVKMDHQRQVVLEYESRPDTRTKYEGGYRISVDKRLASITSRVRNKIIHKHLLQYDIGPLTSTSRLRKVTLADASGMTVTPLSFDWNDGRPSVFDPVQKIATIDAGTSDAQVIPMDVFASGRSDIVIASKRKDELYLAVHPADSQGKVSETPSPGFGPTGLRYPAGTRLLPLDANGDGKTDILHIMPSMRKLILTVLKSTTEGFKRQEPFTFIPDVPSGSFYAGDFEGTGGVGLIYIYQVAKGGQNVIKFVQLTSDGTRFTSSPPRDGPSGLTLDTAQIIVGDLNGKGAEDVFIMHPKLKGTRRLCHIDLIESASTPTKRVLTYRSDKPLVRSGESVLWTDSTRFLPYVADDGGKTSLLVVSKDTSNFLKWQLLRSNGPSFIAPPPPATTRIRFDGNITLSRTSSTFTTDLVNTFGGAKGIQVTILRFDGEKFTPIDDVQQPEGVNSHSAVRWADLRGVGRADCTLSMIDKDRKLSLYSMPCSSSQPVDFISGYENGVGAKTTVLYAPLSDKEVYTATDDPSKTTSAALNAMARNVASSISLTHSSDVQIMGRSRTELVHFPAFVVKSLSTCPRKAKPEVREVQSYTYEDAKLDHDGRGWLGFKSIRKSLQPVGTLETTLYHQKFPFLGHSSKVTTSEAAGGQSIQVNEYTWKSISMHDGLTQSLQLQRCLESYYEAGIPSCHMDVSNQYDSYGNVTQLDIVPSQPNVLPLSILSTFDNDMTRWIIGNKTLEVVQQQVTAHEKAKSTILKQTKHVYIPGTCIRNETRKWVHGAVWSTQSFEYDKTGNQTVVKGPGPARRILTYDDTHSNVASASTFTGTDSSSVLTETLTFDLALGKPLSITDPNGHVISWNYDVLGRILDVSHGDSSGMTVVERHSFHFEEGVFFKSHRVRAGPSASISWPTTKAYLDGLENTWKIERTRPDDPSAMICSEVQHDGAGRAVARSDNYLAGSTPVFSTYKYDTRSRVVKEVHPPVGPDVLAITTSFQYKFESGIAKFTETRSDGKTDDQVMRRESLYFPNPEPSAGNFIKVSVTRQTNELGQGIRTLFDGLGRAISVKDDSDVELSLFWDGLSRQVERRVSKPRDKSPDIISHFSVKYEDDLSQYTIRNELTGSTTVTKLDFIQRTISKISPDETITFKYDKGGKYSKQRLVDVISSKAIVQHFDYDIQGHPILERLSLDGHDFTTSHEWTGTGELVRTTNPDGTSVTRSFIADGETVGKLELADANSVRASIALGGYDNVFSRSLTCEFGNGIKATSSVSPIGALTRTSMSHGNNVVHEQDWKIDAFSRIGEYNVSHAGHETIHNSFQYDVSGQLVDRASDSAAFGGKESFSYDKSGNLSSKHGKNFVNDGWQLMSIQNQQGTTESSFNYSVDGNLIAKLDDKGAETSVMKYDSTGRLVELDKTTFVYDYGGRMIKSTLSNGDVTIYPSLTYEVAISASGRKSHTAYLVHGYRRASLTTQEEPSEKLAVSTSTVYYFHNDHLGSTIAASSEKGEILTRYQYDSFGKVSITGPDIARYKFSGKEQFGSLYYFGARFYDPDMARFLTLDNFPTSLRQIKPSTFNMYTFSQNDPINFVDVNGNAPWWHWIVDVALIVAGVAAKFIPVPGLNQVLSGALLGAGLSGLSYDIRDAFTHDGNNSEWGIQLGLGAAFGAVTGGVGYILDGALPAVTTAEISAARGLATGSAKALAGLAGRTAVRAGVTAAVGSEAGFLHQYAYNKSTGRPALEGVWESAGFGALGGAISSVGGDAFSLVPKPSLGTLWNKVLGSLIPKGTSGVPVESVEIEDILALLSREWRPRAPVMDALQGPLRSGSNASSLGSTGASAHAPSVNLASSVQRRIPARDVTSL